MKKRKIDSVVIDESDVIKFKEDLSQYLNNEKRCIYDNDADSIEEKVIKQLSEWLRKTYSYDVLCQLLTSKEIREEVLNIDVYWLLHMTCTLHFSDFVISVDDDRLIDFIRNAIDSSFISTEDVMITSIVSSMTLFLFNISLTNNENNENNNSTNTNTNYCLNPLLKSKRCLNILEEIAIRTNRSNVYEYSSSSKELHDAIKDTRNLKKHKANFNNQGSLEILQSPLLPNYIGNDDIQIFVMILKIISRDSNAAAVKEWQIRQMCRLSSCIFKSCDNFDRETIEVFEHMIKESIYATIDRELRSTSVSSLDFTFNMWLTESCKSNEITAISFILNKLIFGIDGELKVINYEVINGLIRLATIAATDGVAEDSSMQWLRSVCLIQQIAYITQHIDHSLNSNKMELGLKLLSNWFDTVLGPLGKSSNDNKIETIDVHHLSGKSFGFACLAFCEIVEMVSEECLQIMCNAVRLRKVLNKDAADSFLQVGRTQLKAFISLRKSGNASDDVKSRNVEITEERVNQWCRTIDLTGQLPVAIIQQCNMIGVNGYKIVLSCMKLLIAENPVIRDNCNRIVKAMSTSKPPLCSSSEASEFIADEVTYEGKLDVILATLSIPSVHKVHIKGALQTLQSVNDLVSKIIDPNDKNNSIAMSYLESWKSSSRYSIQSICTTSNIDLRFKVAGLLMSNLLQTITLLASQLHMLLSSSTLSRSLVNKSFVFWYEWMYEAIDTFSDDDDAIKSVSSIFHHYLLGDTVGIIQFPGLALFLSLAGEQLSQKIFTIVFVSAITKKLDIKDSLVKKFCGLIHGALSWTISSYHCYDDNQCCSQGDYLKVIHPLLSATYIWTHSCVSVLSPLPSEFAFLLETICPIVSSSSANNSTCSIIPLLSSLTFQTILHWIVKHRAFFSCQGAANKIYPLLTTLIGVLCTNVEADSKGIKLRKLKTLTFVQDKCAAADDYVLLWSKLVDCITPLFDINKTKEQLFDEHTAIVIKHIISIVANELNLYMTNSWQVWMKCAKADIDKYGVHPKSSISLFIAINLLNERNHHSSSSDNSGFFNDYALWYSYLLSSRNMAVSKSIDLDFHSGYAELASLASPTSPKSMIFHQIPLLLSSEVCNRINNLGSKLYMRGSDMSDLTVNSFSDCIADDIYCFLSSNSNLNDLHLFSDKNFGSAIYPRTLGWTFLSAIALCRVDDTATKSALAKVLEIYKASTDEKKLIMQHFLIGLISSCLVLSPSWINLITIFLVKDTDIILSASTMIDLVSKEIHSQLPREIAAEFTTKFKNMIK